MFTWIISTAQQARPKVIHHKEPVRAQVNKSSAVVTMKPFFVERLLKLEQLLLVDFARNQAGDARQLLLGRHPVFGAAEHHSHSSAPFFHA